MHFVTLPLFTCFPGRPNNIISGYQNVEGEIERIGKVGTPDTISSTTMTSISTLELDNLALVFRFLEIFERRLRISLCW